MVGHGLHHRKKTMTHHHTDHSRLAEQVSAAMDGDAPATDAVAHAWKSQTTVRADWHAFQLIGDVLRSADCANPAPRDEALLRRVRERLAAEPVVLAPAAAAAPAANNRARWWAPAAVAAGFVAVVGLVVVQPQKDAGQGVAVTAAAPGSVMPVGQAGFQSREAAAAAPGTVLTATPGASAPVMIRSAELDRYLAAHKQFAATSAVPTPGVVVRSVSAVAPSR